MWRRSSLLVCALAGCMPEYDPLLICHNANCAGGGPELDDTMSALRDSLALEYDGRPMFDGIEIDTFLFFDGRTSASTCLFAHDSLDPASAATPNDAAALVAEHLARPVASWNGERFYLKVELKPTVDGANDFHTAKQAIQHVGCVLDMVEVATRGTQTPVTVIFDSTSECLHRDLQDELAIEARAAMRENPMLELVHSGPIVAERNCIRFDPDIRTFFVRAWRDTEIEAIRPVMVWLDRRSENTETLKIIRHLRPEFVTTSAAPYVRGWIEGFQ